MVDWVIKRTEDEASGRRKREKRVDQFIFVERIGGLVGGIVISALGLSIAAYLALNGAQKVAGIIGGGTLVSIVSIIVTGRKRSPPPSKPVDSSKKKK